MTTISKTKIEDTSEACYVSPDELMLKELERRDGIYSFIFHELEKSTPADNKLAATVLEISASTTTNTVTTTNASTCATTPITSIPTAVTTTLSMSRLPPALPSLKQEFSDMALVPSKATYFSQIDEHIQSSSSQHDFKKPLPSLVPFRTAFFGNNFTKRHVHTPSVRMENSVTTTAAVTGPRTSTCTKNNTPNCYAYGAYQNVLRENPKLYSYMSNCTVRVRLAPPRFSHVSVPLVRNRRHSLKELPEYKQSLNSNCSDVPDLRELFPNDPDVYAPFITSTSPYDNLNIMTTTASPEMSKTERLSPDIQLEDIQLTDEDDDDDEEEYIEN